VTAPAGAVTAQVWLMVGKPDDSTETVPSRIDFDDVVFEGPGAGTTVQTLFVPAAASAHGLEGTFWTTTGWFSSKVGVPVDLYAGFLRQGQDNSAAVEAVSFLGTIAPYDFIEIDDMAAAVGGAGLTGGLYILAVGRAAGLPSNLVAAETTTFTPNPDGAGAYGQGIPAVGAGTQDTVTVPGLFQDDDHRTNVGALNTSGTQLTLEVSIVGVGGQILGSAQWVLQPYEQRQVPIASLGATTASGGYATFTRTAGVGRFRAYASVVDQHTGDSVYTPGQ